MGTAFTKMEPYYPVLTEESQKQYAQYQALADQIPNLIYCGRLADFKYYNMDQALERALGICREKFGVIYDANTCTDET